MVADVLFSTNDSSPYDLAVVQLRESFAGASVPQMATSFTPGFVTFLVSQRPFRSFSIQSIIKQRHFPGMQEILSLWWDSAGSVDTAVHP